MAKTTSIGLKEKYVNDDTLADKLEKFDAALEATFKSAEAAGLMTLVLDRKKRVSDYSFLGKDNTEKKENLLKFLQMMDAQTGAYQDVLDKEVYNLGKFGIQFDEKLFILIQKIENSDIQNEKLGDLEIELEGLFDKLNLEMEVLMTALSGETDELREKVDPNGNKRNKNYSGVIKNTEDFASDLPNATEDIDYNFEPKIFNEYTEKLDKKLVGFKGGLGQLNNLKKALRGGIENKKKYSRKETKLLKEAFSQIYYIDWRSDIYKKVDVLSAALQSKDKNKIESAYSDVNAYMNKLGNKIVYYMKEFTEAGIADDFKDDFSAITIVDDWNTLIADGFEYLIDNLQTGLNPNDTFKIVEDIGYNYLGADIDSFKDVRRETKTTEDGDKITDRYKGNKQFTTIKANAHLLKIKRTEIENLNWLDTNHGMVPVINTFLAKVGNGRDIPEKYRDFKHEFRSGGKLADYDFGKRYKNDRLEAKRELHKFLWNMQERINKDTEYETVKVLARMTDTVTETDVNMSDVDNARILLASGKITPSNVFDFLCDFDSDGKVTGADEDKKFLNKNRVDTGSVMGIQMLNMMRSNANTERSGGRLTIVEGEKTDVMFTSMFQTILNDTETERVDDYVSFSAALKNEIDTIKGSGTYGMSSFIAFLKEHPEFKGFLINAVKKNDVEVFMPMQDKIEEKEKIAAMDGSLDQVYYNKLDQIRGKDSFKKLQSKLDSETLTNVRAGIGKQVFRVAGTIMNIITSKSTSEAVRNALTGALGISSQVIKRDLTQLEYKTRLGKIFDKITGNIEFDLLSLSRITKDTSPSEILNNLGLWTEFENTSVNYGDTKSVKIGVKFNPPVIAIGGRKGLQTEKNRIDLQNSGNLNAEAVKRRGFGGELSVNILKPWESKAFFEVGREHDYVAGILQQEYNDHMIISSMFGLTGDKIGGYRFGNEVEGGEDGSLSALWVNGEDFEGKARDVDFILKSYFENVNKNLSEKDSVLLKARKASLGKSKKNLEEALTSLGEKPSDRKERKIWKRKKKALEEQIEVIEDEIKLVDELPNMMSNSVLINEVQSELRKDLTDLISNSAGWKMMSKEQKRLFVKQYLTTYMQGFLASVKMRRQESLDGDGVKRGGWKMTFDSTEMAKDIASWAAAGSVASPFGSALGGVGGALNYIGRNVVFGGMFKSYRMNYIADAANVANNYDKINRLPQKDLEVSSLSDAQKYLFEQLKLLGDIDIKIIDNKLVLTGADLHKLNISYVPGIKEQFSYKINSSGEEELVIGNVGQIGTANYYKRTGTEVHLFLGNNRAVDTVRLVGYNVPSKNIDAIGFEPRSMEIGQDGIDELKSYVDGDDLFNGNLTLEDTEKAIIRNKIKAWIAADLNFVSRWKAGEINVSIKSGVTEITDQSEVIITGTKTADASLSNTAADNTVEINFNYSRSVDIPGYDERDVSVNFENGITGEIDNLNIRDRIASSEHRINRNRNAFREYLAAASTTLDYDKAYKKLQTIAWSGNDNTIKDFLNLKTDEEKRLIVNEFKGIFATNVLAHNKKSLDSVITNHTKFFTKLNWKEGGNLSSISNKLIDRRKDLVEDIKNSAGSNGKIEHEEISKNLFGYTAFYRTGSGEDARKYSMTALGATRMLGGTSKKIDITSDERDNIFGKNGPFFENLKKQDKDLEDIVTQVNKALKEKDSDIPDLTKDQVLFLLKNPNESLKLKDVKTEADIIVKPDVDYLFYLLGECANESFGLKLKFKVEKKLESKKESVDGQVETRRQEDRGFDMGSGVAGTEKYIGVLGEDNITVQGSVPVREPTDDPHSHANENEPTDDPHSDTHEDEDVDDDDPGSGGEDDEENGDGDPPGTGF